MPNWNHTLSFQGVPPSILGKSGNQAAQQTVHHPGGIAPDLWDALPRLAMHQTNALRSTVRMYKCICICMSMYVCVCVSVYVHVCKYVCMYVRMHDCMNV